MADEPQGPGPRTIYRSSPHARRSGGLLPRRAPAIIALVALLLVVVAAAVAAGMMIDRSGGQAAQAKPEAPPGAATTAASTSATTTAAAIPRPAATAAVSIVCGGDIMGAWQVDAYIHAHGANAVLAGIKPIVSGADLAFANLESPLSDLGSVQTWKDVTFRGDPRLAPALAWAGFDVMTMANNHALDYKAPALLDSIRRMTAAHVRIVGAGKNAAAAHAPAIFTTASGVKVAFLGYSDILFPGYTAGRTSPGTAAGRTDMARVKADIRAARRRADAVVVAFHWGIERQEVPTSAQRSEARAAIDAGATLVMSHHPHVLQGLQAYHGGLICYSFGDLVFPHVSRATGETMLLRCVVGPKTITAKLIPVYASTTGIPSVLHGSAAAAVLGRMRRLSRALGTTVRVSGDTATVTVTR
jgi:poly-gamma-glutamate capsule biosynthesis protein CapA/YwtB (metallophosphatase superfamily)